MDHQGLAMSQASSVPLYSHICLQRRVLDEHGHPMAEMQSAKADFFGLYGEKRMTQVSDQDAIL